MDQLCEAEGGLPFWCKALDLALTAVLKQELFHTKVKRKEDSRLSIRKKHVFES